MLKVLSIKVRFDACVIYLTSSRLVTDESYVLTKIKILSISVKNRKKVMLLYNNTNGDFQKVY